MATGGRDWQEVPPDEAQDGSTRKKQAREDGRLTMGEGQVARKLRRRMQKDFRAEVAQKIYVSVELANYFEMWGILTKEQRLDLMDQPLYRRASILLDLMSHRSEKHILMLAAALIATSQQHILTDILKFTTDDITIIKDYEEKYTAGIHLADIDPAPGQLLESYVLFPMERLAIDEGLPTVQNIQNSSAELVAQVLVDLDRYYKVGNKPRGRVVIINNEKFMEGTNLSERIGSSHDVTILQEVFRKLDFTIVVLQNLSKKDIQNFLQLEACHQDHERSDMFILFILSHGKQDIICGADGQEVRIREEIILYFTANHCPRLIGKPKLFFIQACQGVEESVGVEIPELPRLTMEGSYPEPDARPVAEHRRVHEWADILLVLASVPGYVSWRVPSSGSWLIQDLMKEFRAHAHDRPIRDIVTEAVRNIHDNREHTRDRRQLCEVRSTFRRILYLLPGYTN